MRRESVLCLWSYVPSLVTDYIIMNFSSPTLESGTTTMEESSTCTYVHAVHL